MKRELLCTKCAESNRKLFKSDTPYPGEHVKFQAGKLERSGLNCDGCGRQMAKGIDAVAFSSWAEYGGVPYFPWESEVISF